jgi:hypothetical protein
LKRTLPILTSVLTALALAACGGGAAAPSSAAPASVAPASAKPASSPASTTASAKPAGSTGASAKPASSGAASGGAAAPAAARTPVVEVAKVPPGPPTPQVAGLANVPVSSRPPLAAKYSQPIGPYSLFMENIASAAPSTAGLLAVPGCVDDSIFKRGMRVIFRYSVTDMSTGKPVTDRDGSTTKVQIASGQVVDGFFAPRGAPPAPPDAPWTWVGVWNIPTDFPLGKVTPTISLTSGGKTSTINPADFGAMPVQVVD